MNPLLSFFHNLIIIPLLPLRPPLLSWLEHAYLQYEILFDGFAFSLYIDSKRCWQKGETMLKGETKLWFDPWTARLSWWVTARSSYASYRVLPLCHGLSLHSGLRVGVANCFCKRILAIVDGGCLCFEISSSIFCMRFWVSLGLHIWVLNVARRFAL